MSTNWPNWERIDQNEYELTKFNKMSTNWPKTGYELTKMSTNWLKYELTWVRIDSVPSCYMLVKLISFYFMSSIAVLGVMFSHIFAEKIKFSCNLRSVTHISKLNVSLVPPRISCNAKTRMYGLVCMFAHIMRLRYLVHMFETYGLT